MTNSSEFFKKLKKVDGGYQITLDDGSVIVGSQISDIIRQMMKKSNDEPSFKKISLPDNLKYFVPRHQIKTMASSDEFEDIANELSEIFEMMPKTYEQDGKGDNAKVYLHYFYGDSHWYIIEKDSEKEQLQMFGYAVLNGDLENAELGYISFDELNENNVELDFHFDIDTLGNIKKELNQRYTYARGGKLKKYDYVPNRNIESLELTKGNKTVDVDGADVIDGVYVKKGKYAKGGGVMENKYAIYELAFGQPYNFYNEEQDKFIWSEPTKATLFTKKEAENKRAELLKPRIEYYLRTGKNYQELHIGDLFEKGILNKYANGGGVGEEKEYVVTLQHLDSGELIKFNVMGTNEDNAIDNAYMETDLNQPYEFYSVKKMANGGGVGEIKVGDLVRWKKDKNVTQVVDDITKDWSEWEKVIGAKVISRDKKGRPIFDKYAKGGGVGKGYKGVRISHYKVGNKIFIDYMDAMEYCDENNISYDEIINTKEYARGGMSEHGLKTGDKITGRSGRGIAQDKKIYQVLATPKSGKPYLLYDGMLMTEKTAERKAMEANRMWAPDILYSVVEVNQIWDGYARGGKVGDFEVGQSVIISRYNDNENYADYVGKELVITHKAVNSREHRGFDESMTGQGLYDFVVRKTGEEVPFSLYDYEIEQYARGGMSEHGLKTGDKITGRSGSTGVKLYNKNRKESGVVNLDKGIRKTKSYGKSEPTIVRGFVDDEPYEYGKGGGIEGKKYIVVCKDTNTGEEQEFEVFAEDRQEAREIALGYCEYSNPKIISIEIYGKGGSLYSRNASKSKNIIKKPIKKKKKKEPTIVRGFVDDEPYEFKKGGSIHSSLMDDFFN